MARSHCIAAGHILLRLVWLAQQLTLYQQDVLEVSSDAWSVLGVLFNGWQIYK